ncbi:MAG: acetate kinase [Paracoccaceae bacterium]|jgi:acetate kinase
MSVVLTLNAGSSSIKFALYGLEGLKEELRGQVERIGGAARLEVLAQGRKSRTDIDAQDHDAAVRAILAAIAPVLSGRVVAGVGHRVVHGGPDFADPVRVDTQKLAAIEALEPLAPLHQPHNAAGLRAAMRAFPEAPQVACFDTGFHRAHPWVHDTYALPERFYAQGVRRYGFHGLSYAFIEGKLAQEYPALHKGRVVVLHLGNGTSACGLRGGRPIATTMGFSPLDGLAMGTRPGQIDPGVLLYLMNHEGMDAARIERLLYYESGLLGMSGETNDMRELLASGAPAAQGAVAYFCARIVREIGALAASLGGIDGIVFTGGIGENSAAIRARVLSELEWLGFEVDHAANAAGAGIISQGMRPALVIATDEERVIASAVAGFI